MKTNAIAILMFLSLGATSQVWSQGSPNGSPAAARLKGMSLEELANVEVTSLSKKAEKRSQVAAAVYVITQEDIRRTSATSIPDLLRVAPGVQVAQVDSNKWAVGIRGFGSRLSRSMLVVMDGRSVYTPLFAGVYWEVQDTLLEDIDQIEVIRGPGGTIWGANAVNGVVNVITKSAHDTQGGLAVAGGGSHERGFTSFRYGGKVRDKHPYRLYGKFFNRAPAFHTSTGSFDDWHMGQAGFRLDTPNDARIPGTLQGDFYIGRTGQRTLVTNLSPPSRQIVERDAELFGGNILGRWHYQRNASSKMTLQTYFDHTGRREIQFEERRDTFDLDFQHGLSMPGSQQLNWGLGYRMSSGKVIAVPTLAFLPPRRTDHLFSGFLQDEILIGKDKARLTLGSKFEHNGYSGFEYQPGARFSWTPVPAHTFWTAASRAVRTPSRLEHDLVSTSLLNAASATFTRILADRNFASERVLSYELGYRTRTESKFLLGVSAFYTNYDRLLSIQARTPFVETTPPPPRTIIPFVFANGLQGRVYGAEFNPEWLVTSRLRVSGTYSYLRLNLERQPGAVDLPTEASTEGSSPRHQIALRSLLNLPKRAELDFTFRFVSALPAQLVGSYATLDVRLGWRPAENVEFSMVGRNLLQDHHAEFGGGSSGLTEVRRSAYGKMTWRW